MAATVSRASEKAELIRGPKLETYMRKHQAKGGVPFLEGLELINDERRVRASNKRISRAFETNEYGLIVDAFACRTGTLTVYNKPGARFDIAAQWIFSASKDFKFIIYEDPDTRQRYHFPIKSSDLELKDALLAVDHPGFSVKDSKGNTRCISKAMDLFFFASDGSFDIPYDVILNFPSEDGCYLCDPKHDIPQGRQVDPKNINAKRLIRVSWLHIGTTERGYYGGEYPDKQVIGICAPLSAKFGEVVEAPDKSLQDI